MDNHVHTSKQEKVLTWLVPFFNVPGRVKGYEQFCEILTKKKSNQKKKDVNIQDNSASYLRSINTSFIIIIFVFNLKMNTRISTGRSYLSSSGNIYYHYLLEGRYRFALFGGTVKQRY